jgi:hypothetical protein
MTNEEVPAPERVPPNHHPLRYDFCGGPLLRGGNPRIAMMSTGLVLILLCMIRPPRFNRSRFMVAEVIWCDLHIVDCVLDSTHGLPDTGMIVQLAAWSARLRKSSPCERATRRWSRQRRAFSRHPPNLPCVDLYANTQLRCVAGRFPRLVKILAVLPRRVERIRAADGIAGRPFGENWRKSRAESPSRNRFVLPLKTRCVSYHSGCLGLGRTERRFAAEELDRTPNSGTKSYQDRQTPPKYRLDSCILI